MSWIFGRKKQQKDTLPDSTEEDQSLEQSDEFVHVPRWPGTNTGQETATYPSGNLYPYVPPVPELGQLSSGDSSKDLNQGDTAHYLNGVPFKLCKQLEYNMNNDSEIDNLRISEILSFIEKIEDQSYDYSFSLEESIVAEMSSRAK
ncbi:hypothetical protein ANTQUA_LOCUS1655 [Anthophora quadrimaculata]